jgi:hypothetical protein
VERQSQRPAIGLEGKEDQPIARGFNKDPTRGVPPNRSVLVLGKDLGGFAANARGMDGLYFGTPHPVQDQAVDGYACIIIYYTVRSGYRSNISRNQEITYEIH